VFNAGVSSSGRIDFTPYKNLGIYLPIKVNGHDATAWLWGGPSSIDRNFAESIGLQATAAAAKVAADIQAGNLTGKPFADWARLAILEFHLADVGTTHAFTMTDGSVRHVKAVDFF
jgi:hypothetical protein